jgi:hypothetical protein
LESEITGELSEGMKYVVNPDETYEDGMTVIPNENE